MTQVIAHRGASAHAPENTLQAFEEAARRGADQVELDVRLASDGSVVVHHDARLADGRAVVDLTPAQLPSSVPSLREALVACAPLGVNVELKDLPGEPGHRRDLPLAAATVAVLDGYRADGGAVDLLVSSFDVAALDRVADLAPALDTAVLFVTADPVSGLITRAAASGRVAIHPSQPATDRALVGAAHAVGLAVNVWTVDDPERMAALIALGVDGIITNVPDVARSVVDAAAEPAAGRPSRATR
ncbi:MAG: glycerophosphodiester phosphodiesterase [Actinomycetota bacterium]|nr:glycerophosphodiester phosphodiesterase [Actinomycetota bacterium]